MCLLLEFETIWLLHRYLIKFIDNRLTEGRGANGMHRTAGQADNKQTAGRQRMERGRTKNNRPRQSSGSGRSKNN